MPRKCLLAVLALSEAFLTTGPHHRRKLALNVIETDEWLTAQDAEQEIVGQLVRVVGVFRNGAPSVDQRVIHIHQTSSIDLSSILIGP